MAGQPPKLRETAPEQLPESRLSVAPGSFPQRLGRL